MRRILLASMVFALAACGGGGPKLKNLRCRADPCQHAEDPFRLQLAVDFEDSTGTLSAGELDLRVGGNTQTAIALRDMFNAQQLALDAKTGTLQIDDDVLLTQVKNGTSFTISFLATNGAGQDSNEPTLTFQVRLGSAP